MSERDGKRLKVVEVGESGRTYLWKRRLFDYFNADIVPHELGYVDLPVAELEASVQGADLALLSYVLSEISTDRGRLHLLRRLHAVTGNTATLILFDDFRLNSPRHRKHRPGSYFHTVQLGIGLLSLLQESAWEPTVVESYPDTQLLASSDLPFIVARKASADYPTPNQ